MAKNIIELLTPEHIVLINQKVISTEKYQKHKCLDMGKLESALAAAFYPGDYPFQYGGIAKVAGALCFFLTKAHAFFDGNKRTAGIAATTFMHLNGFHLYYPVNEEKSINEYATRIDDTAANKLSKEELIKWFEKHKKAHRK